METATAPQTLQFAQEDFAQLANVGGGSISFGPLTLSWDFTLSPLAVNAWATILGVKIGQVTLDPSHPNLSIGGSVGKFTAEIDLSLDVASKSFNYHVEVKVPIIGTIINKSGTISL
jgi:hypothetical protein